MEYCFEKLKSDVMRRLGEITLPPSSAVSMAVPGPADVIGAKIESLLPEVGGRLIREASYSMLGGGVEVEVDVEMSRLASGLFAAEIRLPAGFLRLVSVKMSGWRRSVSELILPGNPGWDCQWSDEEGIAGCPEKPRVYLDGCVLRAVGCRSETDGLAWLRCWCLPHPDSDGKFSFPEALYPELVTGTVQAMLVK